MPNVKVRIEGHLDKQWMDWVGDLNIIHTKQNQTLLTGSVQDQAAVYGLIVKLVSVHYESVHRLEH